MCLHSGLTPPCKSLSKAVGRQLGDSVRFLRPRMQGGREESQTICWSSVPQRELALAESKVEVPASHCAGNAWLCTAPVWRCTAVACPMRW